MILESWTGGYFELNILGYEFPELENEEYDSNWLMIQINVVHPRGRWTSTFPTLLTYEVAKLAEWLEEIHFGKTVVSVLGFTEPNLTFQIVKTGDEATRTLRISFELESRPPWAKKDSVGERDLWVDFLLNEIDLLEASWRLLEQLQRFPPRANI